MVSADIDQTMDSTVVTRAIRREIWPVLRQEGFDRFAGRSAWRRSENKIDVVNFQSFNSYLAESVGCTTFSFSLNLGCFLPFIPTALMQVTVKDGAQLPREYECHLRRRLLKTIKQSELKRTDTWYIGDQGEYLTDSIADALTQIRLHGLSWFQRFEQEEELMRTLHRDGGGETFGFGTKDSPQRHILLGFAELSRKNRKGAIRHLNLALEKLSLYPENPLSAKLRRQLAELTAG
jgi:hypothetical protein